MNIMHKFSIALAWLLVAFFLFGAWGNTFLSPENQAAYAAWGYPNWFHYITALLELAAALLLMRSVTRPFAAGLGAAVMAAAALSHWLDTAHGNPIVPGTVLLVCLITLGLSLAGRRAAGHKNGSTSQ